MEAILLPPVMSGSSFMIGGFVYKYLFLITVSALPVSAAAQSASEEALAEIFAQQDAGLEEAQEKPEVRETILVADLLKPIVTVTANGLSTSIENTGQAVTVIDRDEIESVQGADVTRVLQRTPGLSFTRNGGVGGFTGVNIRGASADQVLVLVDGVRVADPAAPGGGFDFGNQLTGMAGKFDILRGSNSTIWGSEAIGGVVDISTRAETGMKGTLEYGARETFRANVATGVSDEKAYVGLNGSWFTTDGFSAAANGTEADGFQQFAIGGVGFLDLTDSLEIFTHLNWSEGKLDIDGFPPPDFALADTLETQETRRHWGDVGLAYYGNDLTLRAAYSLSDTERDNLGGDGGVTFGSKGRSERVQLRGEYRLLGGLSFAFGGEKEWTEFETNFDAPAETGIAGFYGQLGWVMGRLAIHIGGRIDDHEQFGTSTSFGGDVSYGFGDDWRMRASLGEGFKAPTLYQLLSFYGNTGLEPEESTSLDIGIERGRRDRGLYLALTGFRRDSDNLIGFAFTPERPFGVYQNTDRARAQGIEAEAGIDVTGSLRLSGVYALVDAEDRGSGLDLARRPQHFGTLFADWESGFGLKLGADLRISGASFDNAANTVQLDGYEVLDIRAAFDVGDSLELFGRVENVFDTDYRLVSGYQTPGRGAFVGLRAQM